MKTSEKSKLLSNFIALSIVQGTNFLLPLLVMPYVISKIGTAAFGVIAIAQVVMVYLSTVSDYGFNLTATRDITLHRDDHAKISRIFFTVLATRLLITAFLFVLLLIATLFVPLLRNHFSLYCLGFTYVLGQSLIVSWFFQGKEKMHFITISTLMARLIFVVLVLLFIHRKEDGVYFLFFLGIGNIIAGLFSIFLALRIFKLSFLKPAWPDIMFELKAGWQITLSNLSINTYLYSGIFILRIYTNDLVVGQYSIAERVFFAVRQVLAVFSQAIYPHLCQLSQKSEAAARSFFKQVYLPFLLLIMAGCGLLFALARQIVSIFLTEDIAVTILLLRMLSFVPVIVCLNVPAYQLLLAFNRKKSYLLVFGTATLLNITANIFLAASLGATGTVISIILTEIFIAVGLNRELYKKGLAGYLAPGVT